jgi:hypothetical protein
MSSILITAFQVLDQILGLPTGSDVIASCAEDWWESYKDLTESFLRLVPT